MQINEVYTQIADKRLFLRDDVRYFEVYGGRRSAKSHEVAAIIGWTAYNQAGHFVPLIRKVGATLKDSIFAEYVSFFKTNNIPVQINKTDKEITLPNGSRFRGFGLDDADKLKSLKNATIIHIEEANEISADDFDSLDAGLSPQNYKARIVLTHNPVPQIPGSMHWIQKRFLQIEHSLSVAVINEKANALILRTWYKDNAFCPEETKKVLEGYKDTNPEKYKLWALGEFTKLEGVVYTNWDIVSAVPEGIIHDSIGCGLDFGFSNDPAACVRLWVKGSEMWIKQLVYKTGLTNEDLYAELKAAGVTDREIVTADSAEPKTIEDLRRRGIRGIRPVKKRANYKEDMANRIRAFKIYLIEGDTDIIREMSTYSWARDKNNKQLPKLQDGDDHALDALIMRCHDYFGDNRMHTASVSLSGVI